MSRNKKYKEDICKLFNKYIAPLLQIKEKDFQLIKIDGAEDKKTLCLEAKVNDKNNYLIRTKLAPSQITKIVQSIWQQLFSIYLLIQKNENSNMNNYRESLYESAFVWGIAQWLDGGAAKAETIYNILKEFMSWSMKTYEGNRVKFGVIVDTVEIFSNDMEENNNVNIFELLNHDAAASISDGINTYLVVTKDGTISKVTDEEISLPDSKEAFAPVELNKVCKASVKSNVGICLSESGDIYCFKRKQLRIARLNGKWVGFSYETFADSFKEDITDEAILAEIYKTCLDVSYARTGGCLAICRNKNLAGEDLEKIMPTLPDTVEKFPLIQEIHGNNFFKLPRAIRKEYMGIDGATIIDFKGTVKRIGAIINSVNPGIDGGGRKAATKKLSEFGIAIKISADGYIQILKKGATLKEFI